LCDEAPSNEPEEEGECSQAYSPLRCLEDRTIVFQEREVQSLLYEICFGSMCFLLNEGNYPSIIYEPIDPSEYDFKVGIQYTQGTLYNWYGTLYYDCSTEIITRTNRTALTVRYLANPIEQTSYLTIKRRNNSTGEEINYGMFPVSASNVIPLGLIDREGLPAIGEHI